MIKLRITKEPEVRKKEIMNAAKELFIEKGYEKTSVSDIVKKVDVAKGLFYYYFPKKETLLQEIGDEFADEVRMMWYERRKEPVSLRDDLTDYVDFHLDMVDFNNRMIRIAGDELSPFYQTMKKKLIDIAVEQVFEIFMKYSELFKGRLTNPQYMVRILISGFADLYSTGVTDRSVYYAILDELLGFVPRNN